MGFAIAAYVKKGRGEECGTEVTQNIDERIRVTPGTADGSVWWKTATVNKGIKR
jgi:hypothetical protein